MHILSINILKFLQDLFMLKYLPDINAGASYGLLFIFGLLTSVHCIGMCGGIAISQTSKGQSENISGGGSSISFLFPGLIYNLGRVMAYTFVGGLVGGVGQIFGLSGLWKGIIPIIGGLFMIIMGINLLGIFPVFRYLNIRLPHFAYRIIKGNSGKSPLYIGLLTGLMPCGPLQIMQIYAISTGSVIHGALSMLIFSLGTVPLMFGLGTINSLLNKRFSKYLMKVSAAFVLVLGLIMFGRGMALSGVSLHTAADNYMVISKDSAVAVLQGGVQKVTTSIKPDSYPPIVVQKGIPVRWVIQAKAEDLNECNNAITIPRLHMDKKIAAGENLLEFTPMEEGEIVYTCWMGMIESKITVVNNIDRE